MKLKRYGQQRRREKRRKRRRLIQLIPQESRKLSLNGKGSLLMMRLG
jgi:hypothetical protein